MNLNNVPNYYFEFGCDFNIFLQALTAKSKANHKELFKVAELQLYKGRGERMTRPEFDELYDEYAQIQVNGHSGEGGSFFEKGGSFFELMITFPKRKVFCQVDSEFVLYNSFCLEDFDEMKAIINKCFEITVKNS